MNSMCLCAAICGKLEKWISLLLVSSSLGCLLLLLLFPCFWNCLHLAEVAAVPAIVDLVPPRDPCARPVLGQSFLSAIRWSIDSLEARLSGSMAVVASYLLFGSDCNCSCCCRCSFCCSFVLFATLANHLGPTSLSSQHPPHNRCSGNWFQFVICYSRRCAFWCLYIICDHM